MFLICFGTRPEYIKVKSIINNLKNIKTCFTGQHIDLIKDIDIDYKLIIENDTSNRLNNILINIMKHTINKTYFRAIVLFIFNNCNL